MVMTGEQIGQEKDSHVPDIFSLQAIEGPSTGTEYAKPGNSLSVGRTKSSKVWIQDPAVSEKHGKFEWSGSCWMLYDLGSSNGTKVNGTSLDREGEGVELKDGDIVQFGDQSKLQVKITPVLEDTMTVEQYLRGEASRIEKRLAGKVEQLASRLKEDWREERQNLLAEAVGSQ